MSSAHKAASNTTGGVRRGRDGSGTPATPRRRGEDRAVLGHELVERRRREPVTIAHCLGRGVRAEEERSVVSLLEYNVFSGAVAGQGDAKGSLDCHVHSVAGPARELHRWKRGGSASARQPIGCRRLRRAGVPLSRQIPLSDPDSPLPAHTFHAGDRGLESRWGYAAVAGDPSLAPALAVGSGGVLEARRASVMSWPSSAAPALPPGADVVARGHVGQIRRRGVLCTERLFDYRTIGGLPSSDGRDTEHPGALAMRLRRWRLCRGLEAFWKHADRCRCVAVLAGTGAAPWDSRDHEVLL